MAEANLIVLRTFSSQMEADVAKSALEAAGIDVMIQADSTGGMRPHIAWATGGFRVLVRQEDETAAREVLDSPEERT
jgi:hypothetical protein